MNIICFWRRQRSHRRRTISWTNFCEIVENYRPNLEVMPGGLARLAGNMIAVISLSRSRRRPTPNHCHYQYDQLRPPKTIWPLFRPGKMTKIISSRGTQYFHCRGGEQSSEKFFLQLAQMASTSCGGGCHMYWDVRFAIDIEQIRGTETNCIHLWMA